MLLNFTQMIRIAGCRSGKRWDRCRIGRVTFANAASSGTTVPQIREVEVVEKVASVPRHTITLEANSRREG